MQVMATHGGSDSEKFRFCFMIDGRPISKFNNNDVQHLLCRRPLVSMTADGQYHELGSYNSTCRHVQIRSIDSSSWTIIQPDANDSELIFFVDCHRQVIRTASSAWQTSACSDVASLFPIADISRRLDSTLAKHRLTAEECAQFIKH